MRLHAPIRLSLGLTLLALVLATIAAFRAQAPSVAATEAAIHYNMNVAVDYDKAFLNVTEAVRYTNTTGGPLSTIVFNVPPAAFGAFTLSTATMGETPLTATIDGTRMSVALPAPVATGDYAIVTLRWWGQLPPSNGRYGVAEGVLVLGDWYPMVATWQEGAWEQHQYTAIGDAFFSDVADYDVIVTAPPTVTIAASGQTISRDAGRWTFRSVNARDFALGISSRFETLARKVDNSSVTIYYLPSSGDAAKRSLDVVEQAMQWYDAKIGPYPFATLAVVQSPMAGQHNAQEHAGLFFLRSDVFQPNIVGIYAAHELAHAWFFAAVGDDQIRQPWMDEGLVTSVSLDFYRQFAPNEFPGLWASWGGATEDFSNTLPMNRGIFDFTNGSVYFYTIYRQGATFFKTVHDAIGDDLYWKALKTYYKEYSGRIAQPRDMLRTFRQTAPLVDLTPIYRRYLDYPFLKYATLSVDVGGTEGQVWEGQITIPITLTAGGPTVTLAVTLDQTIVLTATGALSVTAIPLDTQALSHGKHEIVVSADDGGLNQAGARRTFLVSHPTPTPTATATPIPTVTRTPQPPSTATPLPEPSPVVIATPQPKPRASGASTQAMAVMAGAVLAIVIGAGMLFVRRRGG